MADTIKATINAKWLATEVGQIIYRQGKAKVLNVLESQIDDRTKLGASKRIVEDILANITRDVGSFISEVLGDWEEEVEAGGEVSDEEYLETMKEYEEIENILR